MSNPLLSGVALLMTKVTDNGNPETCIGCPEDGWDTFEKLLVEISTHFINLPTDQIDSGIETAQRRICECLGLDLSSLWQWEDRSRLILTLTHLHSPPWGPHPDRIVASESLPWLFKKLQDGETLAFSTENMPPEAAVDKESRRQYGVKSSVVIPLSAGELPIIGVLSFDALREERFWSPVTVNRLKLVAQIFSNALARKEFDRLQRQNQERLALAADSAGAGLWEFDCGTGMFWASTKALSIFGYGPDECVYMRRFETSVYPVDLDAVRLAVSRALEKGDPLDIEYRILAGDGQVKWINSIGRPYFKENGAPDRLLGVSIDITERKAQEAKRLWTEEMLASAIDIAGLGFYEMRDNHQVSYVDERLREILGIAPDDETSFRQFWLAHIHPDDLPLVIETSKKVLKGGVDRFAVDYRYVHHERGTVWLHHLSRVLRRDADGKASLIIGVMQDITGSKLLEEELRANSQTLAHSRKDLQRLAARLISVQEEELRRLSRELHDDLTQRLAVLAIEAGKLELQMRRLEPPPPADALQGISRVKAQLIQVSGDVHRISRQLHPTILDDLGLLRAIESECGVIQQRENIAINVRHQDIPETVPADIALCLYRIVQEGLNNIVRHAGADSCEVFLQAADGTLCLTVADSGCGFDPFVVRNKTGLGLSSMRERVHLVRGDFVIDSLPGRGTSIRVCIPLNGESI